jgi:hypothetical protein
MFRNLQPQATRGYTAGLTQRAPPSRVALPVAGYVPQGGPHFFAMQNDLTRRSVFTLPLLSTINSSERLRPRINQITRWTPDTCPTPGCIIEYTWDSSLPAESRVHTPTTSVFQCNAHKGLTLEAHWVTLTSENTRKNIILAKILELIDGLDPASVVWSYNAKRILQFSLPSATAAQKNTLRTFAETFGANLVIIS